MPLVVPDQCHAARPGTHWSGTTSGTQTRGETENLFRRRSERGIESKRAEQGSDFPPVPLRQSRVFAGALALLLLITGGFAPATARAQAAKADALFDDDKDSKDKDKDKKDKPKPPAVSDRDTIGFTQENAAVQMTELEERMFRLSEALRSLEPENASRLRLALKFSREEQILDQMRETHSLLKDAQISKAETEVKELIAKLEHLRNLLLAEDLDFQLKLARLRQMRETASQLARIIKEERREIGWSRFAIEQRKTLDRLKARKPELETLIADQNTLLTDAKAVSKESDDAGKQARAALRERVAKLRNAASALAADPLFADLQPPHLRSADAPLAEAAAALEGTEIDKAAAAQEKALGSLRDELNRFNEQIAQTEKSIGDSEFQRREVDQTKNREASDRLAEASARLGDAGVSLRKDLIRASVSMRDAEQKLEKRSADTAVDDQAGVMDLLAKSGDDLAASIEKLLVELRTELQGKMVGEVTEMHELQSMIRETTQAQAPKVLQKSRTALIAVNGLSKKESELAGKTEHLLGLVEETEFGIALPTTLRVLAREMHSIEEWLKAGDVASRTVAFETRIEEDFLGVLQAVRRLPPSTPPPPGEPLPTDTRERERELNRLVAELKLVRMLQARLNDETVGVDKTRPAVETLPPALRKEVETLEATQDEIRDSLAKIAERLPFPEDNP